MTDRDRTAFRLNAFIGRSGYCSRRKADMLIKEGRVKVNGHIVQDFSTRVSREDSIYIGAHRIEVGEDYQYLLFNKPVQYLCSHIGSKAKPSIYTLLPSIPGLTSCGRLDFLTSGLLILSNDGEFVHAVTHPRFAIEKQYIVTAYNEIPDSTLRYLKTEKNIVGKGYSIHQIAKITPNKLSIVLIEGKNREIRNICKHSKIRVQSIHRTRIGHISAGPLESGSYRALTTEERARITHVYMH